MKSETGSCIYCGQMNQIMVEDHAQLTEEERDRLATKACSCIQALAAQEKEKAKTQAERNIERLFSDDYPEIEDLFRKALKIMGGCLDSISIDTGEGVKGKMKMKNDGGIRVEKTTTRKTELSS